MCNEPLRPNYLDASILVKLVIDEDYSSLVRNYVFASAQSWRVCTSFCFVEALSVLKRKHGKLELTDRGYIAGSRRLFTYVKNESIRIIPGDYLSLSAFTEAERIFKAHRIDLIDALQLISARDSWPYLASPSKPILLTADKALSRAAGKEGLKSWYCCTTRSPKY